MDRFTLAPHDRLDKRLRIDGPGDLTLYVDYDDVDTTSVDREVVAMLTTLNFEAPRFPGKSLPEVVEILEQRLAACHQQQRVAEARGKAGA
jgi:hypothetical protein